MKNACIILARSSASRLPGKILKSVAGKTVLEHIAERLRLVPSADMIIVATSNDVSDDPIVDFCREKNIRYYRGSLQNPAERFLSCAESVNADYAVRVNGDNFFADPELIEFALNKAIKDRCDFVTNAPGRTFPFGMSVEVVRTSFYRKAYAEFFASRHFEHVTSWLYEHPDFGTRSIVRNTNVPEAKGIQLALDTQQDLDIISAMMDFLKKQNQKLGLKEIYTAYQTVKYGVHS